jgi:hypothetical protein
MNTPETVITSELPTEGWVIGHMTNGKTFILAPTADAAADARAYLEAQDSTP